MRMGWRLRSSDALQHACMRHAIAAGARCCLTLPLPGSGASVIPSG